MNNRALRHFEAVHMDTRQALDPEAIALMLVLCAIWGMQQVVLKATAADTSPIMQIALRSLLGGVAWAGTTLVLSFAGFLVWFWL